MKARIWTGGTRTKRTSAPSPSACSTSSTRTGSTGRPPASCSAWTGPSATPRRRRSPRRCASARATTAGDAERAHARLAPRARRRTLSGHLRLARLRRRFLHGLGPVPLDGAHAVRYGDPMSTHTGSTPAPDDSWTAFSPVGASGSSSSAPAAATSSTAPSSRPPTPPRRRSSRTSRSAVPSGPTPPRRTSPTSSSTPAADGTSATVTWTTDEASTSVVAYGEGNLLQSASLRRARDEPLGGPPGPRGGHDLRLRGQLDGRERQHGDRHGRHLHDADPAAPGHLRRSWRPRTRPAPRPPSPGRRTSLRLEGRLRPRAGHSRPFSVESTASVTSHGLVAHRPRSKHDVLLPDHFRRRREVRVVPVGQRGGELHDAARRRSPTPPRPTSTPARPTRASRRPRTSTGRSR